MLRTVPYSLEIYLQTATVCCCISQHTSLQMLKPYGEITSGPWEYRVLKEVTCLCYMASKIPHAAATPGASCWWYVVLHCNSRALLGPPR